MKKWIGVLLAVLLLTACGGNEEDTTKEAETEIQTKSNEPTQEELNEKLKSEAVQADFVELNSETAEVGKKVFAEGELSNSKEDGIFNVFTLTTQEGDGVGMYTIKDVLKETEYVDGDTVKVYGTYDGKDDLGFPKINSTVIEKK